MRRKRRPRSRNAWNPPISRRGKAPRSLLSYAADNAIVELSSRYRVEQSFQWVAVSNGVGGTIVLFWFLGRLSNRHGAVQQETRSRRSAPPPRCSARQSPRSGE